MSFITFDKMLTATQVEALRRLVANPFGAMVQYRAVKGLTCMVIGLGEGSDPIITMTPVDEDWHLFPFTRSMKDISAIWTDSGWVSM